jgi:phosphoserine phosphatase RsbU/P
MKVLVAEDDFTSRSMLQAMVSRWGFEVVAVPDGVQGWAQLQKPDGPRLALLDWMMPGMDGLEVCRRARQVVQPDPPYLIMVTARVSKGDIVTGLEAGANDYIAKPYHSEELKARLEVGRRVLELQQALAERVRQLEAAMRHVKALQGILPICSYCHKIRNDKESWERLESYIVNNSEASFTHGICPDCMQRQLELLK